MQKFSGKGDTPLPALTPLGAYGAQAQRDTPEKILVTALNM